MVNGKTHHVHRKSNSSNERACRHSNEDQFMFSKFRSFDPPVQLTELFIGCKFESIEWKIS